MTVIQVSPREAKEMLKISILSDSTRTTLEQVTQGVEIVISGKESVTLHEWDQMCSDSDETAAEYGAFNARNVRRFIKDIGPEGFNEMIGEWDFWFEKLTATVR